MATAGFLEIFKENLNGGDPIMRDWLLLRSFTPILIIITSYIIFVKFLGPAYMANRKPIKPIYLISAYNFALVLFYISFVYRGLLFIPKLGYNFFCGNLSHRQGPLVVKFFELGHELYIVRCIELLDTVILVLSKKFNMITNLHVFHHAIIPIYGFVGFRSETHSYLTLYMGMNSFIHIIMYTYYGIAILGSEYQKYLWWKKYLTMMQIIQFSIITIYIPVMSMMGCTKSKTILVFSTFISVIFLAQFINYYRNTYAKTQSKKHSTSDGTRKSFNGSIPKKASLSNGKLSPTSKTVSLTASGVSKTSQSVQSSAHAADCHDHRKFTLDKEKKR